MTASPPSVSDPDWIEQAVLSPSVSDPDWIEQAVLSCFLFCRMCDGHLHLHRREKEEEKEEVYLID